MNLSFDDVHDTLDNDVDVDYDDNDDVLGDLLNMKGNMIDMMMVMIM